MNLCLPLLCPLLMLLTFPVAAQSGNEGKAAVVEWIGSSVHPVDNVDIGGANDDLRPLEAMVGDAGIVALGESLHSAAEPVAFRNRMFRYLVEEMDFRAIVLESGLVESRVLNDYVVHGRGDADAALASGFSRGFDQFAGNRELIRWMRAHNAGISDEADRVRIFGMDVSGSPGDLAARRKPDTPLQYVLDYLEEVDPEAATGFQDRLASYLPVLAGTNGYGTLPATERDRLTAAIEDLVSLIERRRFEYEAALTGYDYDWAWRAAVSARHVDSWFRQMPQGWMLEDGLGWLSEAQLIRDRVMADNLDWVLGQLQAHERVFVFASVGHIAAARWTFPAWMQMPEDRVYEPTPLGAYARARYGSDYVAVMNMVYEGDIFFCNDPGRNPMPVGVPGATWAEDAFASTGADHYLLDLRSAPATARRWLQQERDHRNFRGSTIGAFDIVHFVRQFSSDCVPL